MTLFTANLISLFYLTESREHFQGWYMKRTLPLEEDVSSTVQKKLWTPHSSVTDPASTPTAKINDVFFSFCCERSE